MIGSDAVMKVVSPVRKAIQVNIEVLKEAARVVLAFDGHSETPAHARIDTVGCDQIAAMDQLFLIAPIRMRDPCRNAIRL